MLARKTEEGEGRGEISHLARCLSPLDWPRAPPLLETIAGRTTGLSGVYALETDHRMSFLGSYTFVLSARLLCSGPTGTSTPTCPTPEPCLWGWKLVLPLTVPFASACVSQLSLYKEQRQANRKNCFHQGSVVTEIFG